MTGSTEQRVPDPRAELVAPAAEGTKPAGWGKAARAFPFFALNVSALLALGVGVSAWFLRFTDWFPEIGGVLALGGLASWLAFVSRVISDDRLKQFQRWVDERFLSRPRTTLVLVVAAVALVAASVFRGTIAVASVGGPAQREVRIYAPGADAGEPLQLPLSGEIKVSLPTSPGRHSRYLVKVGGYPDLLVEVAPWRVATRHVPASFAGRPVVVLLPDPDLIATALNQDNQPMLLHATLRRAGSPPRALPPLRFDGHAVLVGCDGDVEVPEALQLSWRTQLDKLGRSALTHYWTEPAALEADGRLELTPGDELAFHLSLRGEPFTQEQRVRVAAPGTRGFLQPEAIHEAP